MRERSTLASLAPAARAARNARKTALLALLASSLVAAASPPVLAHAAPDDVAPACGDAPHRAENQRPEGHVLDLRPLLETVFRDVDHACGALEWGMSVDGNEVAAEAEDLGGVLVLRHQPILPLAPGEHTVRAWVKERCCTPDGAHGGGETTWRFTVVATPGEAFAHDLGLFGTSFTTALRPPEGTPTGPVEITVATSEVPLHLDFDPDRTAEPTRVPVGDLTTITLCPEGRCPDPFGGTTAGPATLTVRASAAGHTVQGTTEVPLLP